MQLTAEFYQNAIQFSLCMLKKFDNVNHIEVQDIVYDAICSTDFNMDKWKSIITTKIYREKHRIFHYTLEQRVPEAWIEHRYCKCCDMVMPEDYFISGYNAITHEWQYRTICKFCYRKTDVKKAERKRYYEKYKAELLAKNRAMRKQPGYVDRTAKERYERWKQRHKEKKVA